MYVDYISAEKKNMYHYMGCYFICCRLLKYMYLFLEMKEEKKLL